MVAWLENHSVTSHFGGLAMKGWQASRNFSRWQCSAATRWQCWSCQSCLPKPLLKFRVSLRGFWASVVRSLCPLMGCGCSFPSGSNYCCLSFSFSNNSAFGRCSWEWSDRFAVALQTQESSIHLLLSAPLFQRQPFIRWWLPRSSTTLYSTDVNGMQRWILYRSIRLHSPSLRS